MCLKNAKYNLTEAESSKKETDKQTRILAQAVYNLKNKSRKKKYK